MADLKHILAGNNDNHILPFLWMREQSEETLRTEISKIYECGIRAVCLESRPHPDFMGEGWWRDFDIVLDEARRRGMKVWILDDAHFPTGQANGQIPVQHPELARRYLMMQFVDCAGPVPAAQLDVNLLQTRKVTWLDLDKKIEKPLSDETRLVSVVALPLVEGDVVAPEPVDLTDCVRDGWLHWDVPAGVWRICVTFVTFDFGSHSDYVNYVDAASVCVLVDEVYEKHYARYPQEFGSTIAGFFSDEPGFYSVPNYEMRNAIGRKWMALPWGDELESTMDAEMPSWREAAPYLWLDTIEDGLAQRWRRAYMDRVSRLYAKNFSCQLGDWCRAHGVDYIGHVVEDYEEHSRLGQGAGHYFRAMEGQSWAGIDDIGGQVIPGNPYGMRHGFTDTVPGQFYHFCLPKMGASAAAIDPAKQGRLMCEAYGAYGWSFGVKHMRWLTDFLIFQGVNNLVPHAFSMADYPDIDCPPHFYARGNNGQFRWLTELMRYANRLCDLLSDGQNVPQVAVMYPAESDWMSECMKVQDVSRALLENQIDFEVVPTDVFCDRERYGAEFANGQLVVNGRSMKAIVMPQTPYLDLRLATVLAEAQEAGVPVVFVDGLPRLMVGDESVASYVGDARVVALPELVGALKGLGCKDVRTSGEAPNLLAYHYLRDDQDIYCLFNTSLSEEVRTTVTLPVACELVSYDAQRNVCRAVAQNPVEGGVELELTLRPYESLVLVPEAMAGEVQACGEALPGETIDLSRDWKVSAVRSIDYPAFGDAETVEVLVPYSEAHPGFAGILRYERTVELEASRQAKLVAEHVYEVAEAFVNGISAGSRMAPPYEWDLSSLLSSGKNELVIEVANVPTRDTLANPGIFGPDREVLEPSGLFGRVTIK